jgi:transcriptional regulator with XRE-family HTH domain
MHQGEFADAVGLGKSTLQKIELGAYSASDGTVRKIAERTGLDISWLARNDLAARPINCRGRRYSRKDFELAQGGQILQRFPLCGRKADRLGITNALLDCYDQARTIFLGNPNASSEVGRFLYRFSRLIDDTVAGVGTQENRKRIHKRMIGHALTRPREKAIRTIISDAEEALELLEETDNFTQRLLVDHPYSEV